MSDTRYTRDAVLNLLLVIGSQLAAGLTADLVASFAQRDFQDFGQLALFIGVYMGVAFAPALFLAVSLLYVVQHRCGARLSRTVLAAGVGWTIVAAWMLIWLVPAYEGRVTASHPAQFAVAVTVASLLHGALVGAFFRLPTRRLAASSQA